jgi:chromosome segregation ATPase
MTDDTDEYITAVAAGAILGVSPRQAQRYGADPEANVRTRQEGRRVLYHAEDIRRVAAEREASQQRVIDATSHSMSRPNEWRERYDQAQAKLEAAAHTIGELEERLRQTTERHQERIHQLETERDARPLLEDHTTLKAEHDALSREVERLRTELQRAQRPWWRRLFTT